MARPRAGAAARLAAGRRGGGVNAGGRTGANDAADGRAQVYAGANLYCELHQFHNTYGPASVLIERACEQHVPHHRAAWRSGRRTPGPAIALPVAGTMAQAHGTGQRKARRPGRLGAGRGGGIRQPGAIRTRPAQPLRQRRHRGREGLARPGHRQPPAWRAAGRGRQLDEPAPGGTDGLYRQRTRHRPVPQARLRVEGELRDYAVRDGRHVNAYAMARLRDADPR